MKYETAYCTLWHPFALWFQACPIVSNRVFGVALVLFGFRLLLSRK